MQRKFELNAEKARSLPNRSSSGTQEPAGTRPMGRWSMIAGLTNFAQGNACRSGCIEQPAGVSQHGLPGVMLASAAQRLIALTRQASVIVQLC